MEILTVTEIWRYFRWLPKFILRRIFTKERLADLIIFDVEPRHRPVLVNLSDGASVEMRFQIINMSPFEIELDRGEFDFYCAGARKKIQHVIKKPIKSGEISRLFVHGELDPEKSEKIAKNHKNHDSAVTINCDFNCSLHNFPIENKYLTGLHVEFLNPQWRTNKSDGDA